MIKQIFHKVVIKLGICECQFIEKEQHELEDK